MLSLTPSAAYRSLPHAFFSEVPDQSGLEVSPVVINSNLAEYLKLDNAWPGSPQGLAVLSGQATLDGQPAIAMAYAGHQFGHWSGLLGDGRARLAGEVRVADGKLYELHLKGAGQTPYSRRGDGKATLGSAIREYIVSENMAALGVPTTRSLSVVTTGETIQRTSLEPGAILCRSARSHVRVGTFQYAAATGGTEFVQALADFCIDRLYPDAPNSGAERYRYFYKSVIAQQAKLIASWMGFGFIHGVMNTDNMCISGETIDYGPCAFMDNFHPAKVFSSIDRNGRYAWNKQPEMAHWNLARLAESLLPLLADTDEQGQIAAETDLNTFISLFQVAFNTVMSRKFGLPESEDNEAFFTESFTVMMTGEVDFTLFFRRLTQLAKGGQTCGVVELFKSTDLGEDWLEAWKQRTKWDAGFDKGRLERMQLANPVVIARNHQVQKAISDADVGNFETFNRLIDAVSAPFSDESKFAEFELPPEPDEIVERTFCGT